MRPLRELLKDQKASQPFDFKFLGNIDIEQTLVNLNTFTEEQWTEHSYRNSDFRAHSMTNTVEILWDPDCLKTGFVGKKNKVNYDQIDFNNIKSQLQPLYTEHYGPGWFIRALIPRLEPGGSIPIHRDGGKSLMEVKRTHIPLVTNENIFFKVGETTKNLKAGEVWEINNAKEHAVNNDSDEYRIHLIVDYLPKS
jgi:hypothetical protein